MKTRYYLTVALLTVVPFIAAALFGATLLLITPTAYAAELASEAGIPVPENKGLVQKTEGQYTIITKVITLFPDHAHVKMVVGDFVMRQGFPVEILSTHKGLEKIRLIESIDLIEEKGETVGIRGYADGEEILTVRFREVPKSPNTV
ncbi:MAG: hypothetical protein WC761_06655 [Candidatus Paceibacterota bacterium]